MGTSVMVPLEEYLRTSYEPDREWVDGVVKERGMPDGYHDTLTIGSRFIFRRFEELCVVCAKSGFRCRRRVGAFQT